jgi:predicted GNAT family acetyltransferase
MLAVEPKPLAHLVEQDLETLMHAHWKECSVDQEEVPFDPDWLTAYTMERCGILRAFGLYRHEHLVGYSVFEVSSHLHFKSTKYAYLSGTYVVPEHRGFAGVYLAGRCEELLKEMGVRKIVYSAPTGSALGKVLRKLGYEPTELYYTKLVE